jgi:hypothetical protein
MQFYSYQFKVHAAARDLEGWLYLVIYMAINSSVTLVLRMVHCAINNLMTVIVNATIVQL